MIEFNQLHERLKDEFLTIDEKMSALGRRKLKRAAKKNKLKLKIARKKAMSKKATPAILKKRAARAARYAAKKNMFGSLRGKKLNNAQRNRMQDLINKRPGQLNMLRRKSFKAAVNRNR